MGRRKKKVVEKPPKEFQSHFYYADVMVLGVRKKVGYDESNRRAYKLDQDENVLLSQRIPNIQFIFYDYITPKLEISNEKIIN